MALASHRHFGRAAESCYVSQPTLSTQVRKLEEELGAELFDRSFQPVRPTEIGEQVVKQARIVLAERDRIPAIVTESAAEPVGELRLAIIPTLVPYLMPLVAGPFAERFPRIELTVQEMTTRPLIESVAENRSDAGLVATAESHRGLESAPLFDEPFVAYIGPDEALGRASLLKTDDLLKANLWLLDEGHCLRDQVLALCERNGGPSPRMRFRSGSLETLRHLIDRVGGVTLLPHLATAYLEGDRRDRVRPFAAPAPARTVRVIHRRATLKQALIDALTSVVTDTVRPHLT